MVKKIFIFAISALLMMQFSVACSDKFEEGNNNLVFDDDDDEQTEKPEIVYPETYTFNHPCAYVSQSDIDRVKSKVAEANPSDAVYASWLSFCKSPYAQSSYVPNPVPILVAGDPTGTEVGYDNSAVCRPDAVAAFQLALRWKISGEVKYADAAINILNAWASTLRKITANDANQYLLCGFQGYTFANAGELMRDYEGWAAKDFEAFKKWMVDVWYPKNYWFVSTHCGSNNCDLHCWSNWELCNMMSIMAIGILTDDVEKINFVYKEFCEGTGSGCLYNMVPFAAVPDPSGKSTGMLAQSMESGRDQGHGTLVISLSAELSQMASNIGLDFFGMDNNKLLPMFEYTAKYNVKVDGRYITTTMPFTTYTYCGGEEGMCGCNEGRKHDHGAVHTSVSDVGRGKERPGWDLIYNHYTKVKGLSETDVYYTKLFAEQLRYTNGVLTGDGGAGDARYGNNSGAYDQLGWGTMLFTR